MPDLTITKSKSKSESNKSDVELPSLSSYPILDEMWRLGFLADESEFTDDELAMLRKQLALETALENSNKENSNKEHLGQEKPESAKPPSLSVTSTRDFNRIYFEQAEQDKPKLSERHRLWLLKQTKEISHIGKGISSGLEDKEFSRDRLALHNLDVIKSVDELSEKMGVSLAELRFLSYSKKISTIRHYRTFEMKKKSGGVRKISAPMPRLKRLQYWILDNILNKIELHSAVHGFVKGRSICSNARPHIGSQIVVNLDLDNFFPTISYPRVKGLFRSLGYSHQLATVLALLCTEYDFNEVMLNDQPYYIGKGERKLPQGAPSSPAISNILCRHLDRRLAGLATKMDYVYTRYADDLSFSTRAHPAQNVQKLLWRCRKIIEDEGFKLNKAKTKIMRKHRQQKVTGLVVNEKLSIDRKTRKKFRALLYQLNKGDIKEIHWLDKSKHALADSIMGFAHFLKMVESEMATNALNMLNDSAYMSKHKASNSKPSPLNNKLFRRKAAEGVDPRENWWQAKPTVELKEISQGLNQEPNIENKLTKTITIPEANVGVNDNKKIKTDVAVTVTRKTKSKSRASMLIIMLVIAVVVAIALYYSR